MTRQSIVVAGSAHFAGTEILAHFAANGITLATTGGLDREDIIETFSRAPDAIALVLIMPQPVLGTAFLDVDDEALETSMERMIDLIMAIGVGLESLPDEAAIVVVGNRGYLGGWGGTHEMAMSGAMMGFVRSAALAAMPRGIRVNAVALDLPTRTPVDPSSAAALTLFLATPASAFVDGEIILANRGRSMLLREAARRG